MIHATGCQDQDRMAGMKQHYIPQFLLRSFGRVGGGKNAQVMVHSRLVVEAAIKRVKSRQACWT